MQNPIEGKKLNAVLRSYLNAYATGGERTSNDSRITGVVLGNVLLDLTDQVSTHISSLGVDATTHTSKQGNRGSAQSVSGNGFEDALPVVTIHLEKRRPLQQDSGA